MATKREYVIEGNTPGKPLSKRHSSVKSRRSLFNDVQKSQSCSKRRICVGAVHLFILGGMHIMTISSQ